MAMDTPAGVQPAMDIPVSQQYLLQPELDTHPASNRLQSTIDTPVNNRHSGQRSTLQPAIDTPVGNVIPKETQIHITRSIIDAPMQRESPPSISQVPGELGG